MTLALLDLFAAPAAGLALLALPLVAWALIARDRHRARRLTAVVGRRAEILAGEQSSRRIRIRTWLAVSGLTLCVLAWMQPRFGAAGSGPAQSGTDLCICLDVSRSMLARDVQPSRLQNAHDAITALARRTRGDRLALVLFAGAARLRVPLTRDVESFAALVRSTDPVDVPIGGTNIGDAIDAAVRALAMTEDPATANAPLEGAVLLVTDGEDRSGSGREAALRARARGLQVHCVGLGSALGSKITVTGADGRETFLCDRSGREVVSRMDAASLRALAAAGRGMFVDSSAQRAPLVHVYERGVIPELRSSRESADSQATGRANRYQLPLGLGVLLLLVELALGQRRRRRPGAPVRGGLS